MGRRHADASFCTRRHVPSNGTLWTVTLSRWLRSLSIQGSAMRVDLVRRTTTSSAGHGPFARGSTVLACQAPRRQVGSQNTCPLTDWVDAASGAELKSHSPRATRRVEADNPAGSESPVYDASIQAESTHRRRPARAGRARAGSPTIVEHTSDRRPLRDIHKEVAAADTLLDRIVDAARRVSCYRRHQTHCVRARRAARDPPRLRESVVLRQLEVRRGDRRSAPSCLLRPRRWGQLGRHPGRDAPGAQRA